VVDMSVRRFPFRDAAIIAVITTFAALVSQRWSGFNSPDSEFYASLAVFGSDVTDRAIEPAYTWTRLGYIAPVRGLTTLFGPWVGFEMWRIFLIACVVVATYSIAHIAGRPRTLGVLLALAVSLNTVVLAFVGNTYLTGTVIALTSLLIALSVSMLGSAAHQGLGPFGLPRWTTPAASGFLLGWLLMVNPYGMLLGLGLWVSVRLVVLVRIRTQRLRRLIIDAAVGVLGFAVAVTAYLLAGRLIFPGRSWWSTYIEWNSRLDYTVFIGDATTWQRDSALLVVVIALLASIVAVITHPRHRWAWAALALSSANIGVTTTLMLVMRGPWLEAPTYVAKLWPASLLALVLVFTSMFPGSKEDRDPYPWLTVGATVIAVPVFIWAGRFASVLEYQTAVMLALAALVLTVLGLLTTRWLWNRWVAVVVLVAIVSTFTIAQVLQNGRGNLGIYGQYPFRSAFVDFNYRDQMATKIDIQHWLVNNTSADDQIALWTDPDRLTADIAGMQLWGGYNLVTVDSTLDRGSTQRLEEIRPSVIAMYAPSREQIEAFYRSLPPWSLPSDLECTSGPYLGRGTGEAHVCLTRLTWVG